MRGGWFRFGDEEGQKIAVSLYAPFASAKRPKPVQVHCRDLSEVHCETVFVNTAVGAYVEREALRTKFAQIGDVRAVVTQDELAKAKRAVEEDGIHLFGFREDTDAFRETFLRWARTGRPARLMRPAGADDKSGAKSGHRAKYTSRGDGRLANGGDANADAHHHTSETTASAENGAWAVEADDALRPSEREMRENSRSRSAILHVLRRRDAAARTADLERAAYAKRGWSAPPRAPDPPATTFEYEAVGARDAGPSADAEGGQKSASPPEKKAKKAKKEKKRGSKWAEA